MTTQLSSYYLVGQLTAVRVRTGTSGNGALCFAYADHLGNIAGLSNGSALITDALASYDLPEPGNPQL